MADGTGGLLAGRHAPVVVLLAFIPMYFIAQAYKELNQADPDCGTTFTWATRAFGAITGWMGGWGIIIADIIVMSNLAYIAGQYTFIFIGGFGLPGVDRARRQLWASTIVGLLWIAVMTYICYRGIEISARIQYVLLGFELVMLLVFALIALGQASRRATASPGTRSRSRWDWFNPFRLDFGEPSSPRPLLTAIFIYWGWDSAVSVNEETTEPGEDPRPRGASSRPCCCSPPTLLVTVATVSFAGIGDEGHRPRATPTTRTTCSRRWLPTVFGSGVHRAHPAGPVRRSRS